MKNIFLTAIILLSLNTYSQDTAIVKQIDAMVKLINSSGYKIQRDTIKQDQPAMGFSSQTYLSMLMNSGELKKYVNDVHMTMKERKVHGTNTFYFDKNKLIKVEEFMIEGNKKVEFEWYYSNGKPVYNTLKSEKDQERAEFLLKTAQAMLEKMTVKQPG
jgi:hypothetical protein